MAGHWRSSPTGPHEIALWTDDVLAGILLYQSGGGQEMLRISTAGLNVLPRISRTVSVFRPAEGCIVQTVADLRSDRRWIVIFVNGEFVRMTPLSIPMAVLGVDSRGHIVGYSDIPRQSGLLLFVPKASGPRG